MGKNHVLFSLFVALACLPLAAQVRLIQPNQMPTAGHSATFGVQGIAEAKTKDGTPQTVPFVIYLPSNHGKDRKWPVILEWHGAGGRAGVGISQRITNGKDFICVGLTYINLKSQTEYQYIDVAIQTALNLFKGNEKAVFPGGFSFGGLAQERFILSPQSIGRFRAVWMFGAGLVRPKKNMDWLKNTPFFIAVGEKDFNRKPVEQMLPRFRKVIKNIEFHVMAGQGHSIDFKTYGPKLLAFLKSHVPQTNKNVDDKIAEDHTAETIPKAK